MLLQGALIAVLLLFLPFLLDPFEGPKAAVLRIAGLTLLVASALELRGPRRVHLGAIDLAIAAWLAVEIASTLAARSPALAVFGEWEQQEGLLTSFALAGVWLGARHALREVRGWERTLDLWFAGTAVACAVAVMQAVGMDPIAWARTATIGGALRPFGTLGHPNLLGLNGAAAAAAATARAVAAPAGRRWYAAAALWFAIAVLLTLSRAAWLGLAAGIGIAALLALRAPGATRPGRVAVALGGGAAVLALVVLAGGGWSRFAGRAAEIATASGGSGQSRLEIWRIALAEWRDRPWLGQGPDNFYLAFHRFQTPAYWRYEWGAYALHAHSIYLHVLATRGLLGAAALMAVAIAALVGLWRGWHAGAERRLWVAAFAGALVAIAVAGAFGALGVTGSFVTALLLAGTAWVGTGTDVPVADAAPAPGARRVRARAAEPRAAITPAGAASLLVAVVMTVVSVRTLGASRLLWMGRDSLDQLPGPVSPQAVAAYDQVAARLRDASRTAFWDDLGPRLLSETLTVSGNGVPGAERRLRDATAAAREAIRREPLRPDGWRRLGDALASRTAGGEPGLAAACDSAFAQAVALAPHDCYQLVQWSRARLAIGLERRAAEPVERAIALYPERGNPLAARAEVEAALGDSAAARRDLERALTLTWYDDGASHDNAVQLRAALGGR